MSDLEIFGPIVTGADVEDAVERTLKEWMQTYLRRMERHISKPPNWLPNPGSYIASSDWDHFPEEQVPAILMICPDAGRPEMDGKREYRTTFPIQIGIFVEGQDRRSSERLAKYYGAALRELLTHKGSLGNFAEATCWEGEQYGVHISDRSQRTFGTAEVKLSVEVRQVSRRLAGPAEPLKEPATEPGPLPTVTKNTPVQLTPQAIQ
jgi:hypothetical protein